MLRKYNVFDLGQNSLYEDDERNCDRIRYLSKKAYLPAIDILLNELERNHGEFRCAVHASIPALELFEQYCPEVVDGLVALSDTKAVEFVAGAAHSLAFLYSKSEFSRQLASYTTLTKEKFGQTPTCFCSTELIYNNDFASFLESQGYTVMLAEGADHILGWRSPNFVYQPEHAHSIRLLLRNRKLSKDLSLRFSDRTWDKWPLTADSYAAWLAEAGKKADTINIFLNMSIFGIRNTKETGIFDFLKNLPTQLMKHGLSFATPTETAKRYPVRDSIDVKQFISWDDAGGDLNSWLGNDMQKDAVHFLYSLTDKVHAVNNPELLHDFTRLQTSNYLRWMSTKWFSSSIKEDSPFASAQDAYITYMNILADFEMRLEYALASTENIEQVEEVRTNTAADEDTSVQAGKNAKQKQLVA
ncbi:MAG: glycoside hydrolase family 57 protein [Desulfovibrio sp.]|nr:glycoside hydrolase family 57 protein [Desulfovibrio sp.]